MRTEKAVAFSFTANLLSNADGADAFAAIFRSLYVALDDRHVSYRQGTLTVVVDTKLAEAIRAKAQEAGTSATVKDM